MITNHTVYCIYDLRQAHTIVELDCFEYPLILQISCFMCSLDFMVK